MHVTYVTEQTFAPPVILLSSENVHYGEWGAGHCVSLETQSTGIRVSTTPNRPVVSHRHSRTGLGLIPFSAVHTRAKVTTIYSSGDLGPIVDFDWTPAAKTAISVAVKQTGPA